VINGDSGFTSANGVTGGSGTSSDPYIIQGWNLSSTGPGISINNTNAYFAIRNVVVVLVRCCYPGITMSNVTNGAIDDSQIGGYPWSIMMTSSQNVMVSNDNNKYDNNKYPALRISIASSGGITVTNDTMYRMDVSSSADLSITDNQIYPVGCGLCISNSSNLLISGNNIPGCDCPSVSLDASDHVTLSDNIIGGDRPLRVTGSSEVEISDNKISGGADHGAVGLSYCSNVSFERNQVASDAYGAVEITNCIAVDLSGNSIVATQSTAVSISQSSNATIDSNNIQGSTRGVVLNGTQDIRVFHNNFLNNALQAQDTNSAGNVWDNGYPSGGNFWSDYTGVDDCSGPQQNICTNPDGMGDTPYMFSNNQDNYPLMMQFVPDPPATVTTSSGGGGGGSCRCMRM